MGNQGEPGGVRRGERLEPVGAAVDQASCFAEIVRAESGANSLFVSLEEAGEQSGGDGGVVGKIGIFDELIAQSDRGAMQCVVGAAGELDEAAAFEALAIGRPE